MAERVTLLLALAFFLRDSKGTAAVRGTDGSRGYTRMHEHEWAFHYVNSLVLAPKLQRVYGRSWEPRLGINYLYARELMHGADFEVGGGAIRVLSIGSGDCSTELNIAAILASHKMFPAFVCFDPSDEASVGFEQQMMRLAAGPHQGFSRAPNFTFTKRLSDYARESFDAVFIHHALHHVSDLEGLLAYVQLAIGHHGVVVISDMISRSGHRRWPEQLRLARSAFRSTLSINREHDPPRS